MVKVEPVSRVYSIMYYVGLPVGLRWKSKWSHLLLVDCSSMTLVESKTSVLNPVNPKSDQHQNSPAASPEIKHHTVRRTWLCNTLLRWKMTNTTSIKGQENVFFELRSERVKVSKIARYAPWCRPLPPYLPSSCECWYIQRIEASPMVTWPWYTWSSAVLTFSTEAKSLFFQ